MQFIAKNNNSDVLDDGNVDKLKAGLISEFLKNVNNTVPAATKYLYEKNESTAINNADIE